MQIVKMDNQGRGITYVNGKICFVNNALPLEDVDIKIVVDKKRYCIADVNKYNTISKKRIKAKCKYYGICGGCQLQHISYKNQLDYKINYLNETFKDLNVKVSNIIKSNEFYYRNKITLKANNNSIGYNKLNSNDTISINSCLIADKIISDKIKYLKDLKKTNIKEIILKTFNNKCMLTINGNNVDTSAINNFFDTVYINNELVYGKRMIANIDKIKYYIAPNAFFQVNTDIASKMFKYIKDICVKNKAKKVIDLYCGCGSISLFIARVVDYVYGIELNKESINDANDNKELNNIQNVDFLCDTTDNIKTLNTFDTIIIDPPRSGLSKKVINKILNSNINTIIYVSCEPPTLKRDLNIFKEKYIIDSITAFDMFPNTYHVECVCLLKLINKK